MAVISVLLVDDDAAALASARAVLGEAGYAVTEAFNGRQALSQVMANPADLLITQILMPDGDGIELITAVKGRLPGMRIIAVSDRRFLGDLDLFKLASNLGADAVLDKPIEADELLDAVGRVTGAETEPN